MDGKSTSQGNNYDIRLATVDDVQELVRLGKEFVDEIDNSELYNPEQFLALAKACIDPQRGIALVLTNNEAVVGSALGIYSTHPFNPEVSTLLEIMWYVGVEARGSISSIKMFKLFENLGWDNGVSQVHISARADLKHTTVDKLYTKLGYTQQDYTYVKKR